MFRYKNYVFLGDEVFPATFDLAGKARIPARASCTSSTCPTSNIPRKVAEYDVPEDGPHNMWVEDDVMYIGYYSGGARVVDVSGELRGESLSAGPRDRAAVDGRRERIPAEPAVRVGSAAAQRADLLQRHPHWNLGHESGRSSRTRQTEEALTVDGSQDVDASSLWTDVDAAHHRQGREVENFDRAWLGRNAFHGDERVAVIGRNGHAVDDPAPGRTRASSLPDSTSKTETD